MDPVVRELDEILGQGAVFTDPERLGPFLEERRGRFRGAARCLVMPRNRDQVAATVRLAAEAGIPIVPQGGNTGLVAGALALQEDNAILLNLARLDRIRAVNAADYTMIAEAGCILHDVQQAATDASRLFPLSLGSEGTCQIGGNLSTNAGGIHVLRYGTMRDLVLGIEAVLANGDIWDGLAPAHAMGGGCDLTRLLVGAEGTLGIVTAATLKLFPLPIQRFTAMAAVASPAAALTLFARCREASGDLLGSFELIPRIGLDFALQHIPGIRDPLETPSPWYVLIEATTGSNDAWLQTAMERLLESALEDSLIGDAAVATNEGRALEMWRIREAIVEAQPHEGGSIKHDISVPIRAIPAFIDRATAIAECLIPGSRPVPFGHVGDGNIHFNLSQPAGAEPRRFLARWDEVNAAIHELAVDLDGSISAEHGIGYMKIEENLRFKPAAELRLMQAVKRAFDPEDRLNPGKVVPRMSALRDIQRKSDRTQ